MLMGRSSTNEVVNGAHGTVGWAEGLMWRGCGAFVDGGSVSMGVWIFVDADGHAGSGEVESDVRERVSGFRVVVGSQEGACIGNMRGGQSGHRPRGRPRLRWVGRVRM